MGRDQPSSGKPLYEYIGQLSLWIKLVIAGIVFIFIQVICVATNFTPLLSVSGVGEITMGVAIMDDLTGSFDLAFYLAPDYSMFGGIGYLSIILGFIIGVTKLVTFLSIR